MRLHGRSTYNKYAHLSPPTHAAPSAYVQFQNFSHSLNRGLRRDGFRSCNCSAASSMQPNP